MRLLLLFLLIAHPALADRLSIALQSDIVTLDPHVAPAQTSEAVMRHIYGTLVDRDPELHITPSLATGWRSTGPTSWEFTLRPGVTFSDGTPLRPEDVAFSIARVRAVKYGAGTYAPFVRAITSVTVEPPGTIRIETAGPYPQLLGDLCRIAIISATLDANATTEDFNRGPAAVGTGPFKLVSWSPGASLRLARNPLYWGPPPAWDDVSIQPIANDAARLTALLSGTVDLIDKVPLADIERLRNDHSVRLAVHDGNRSMFLAPNFGDKAGAYLTDAAGHPLPSDPMRIQGVRRAMSLAINRAAIVSRVMGGLGSPANQVVPPGMFGFDSALPPAANDPEAARRLLAEAGYPDGFHLVLHCSSGRYVNDVQICQASAQMLSRIGIRTEVVAEPQSVFYARLSRQDFALVLNGWGSDTGDSVVVLLQALHSATTTQGGFNRGHYANPELDALIEAATTSLDPVARELLQRRAMDLAMADAAVIPLYTSAWVWGSRPTIRYQPGFEEGTFAARAIRAP